MKDEGIQDASAQPLSDAEREELEALRKEVILLRKEITFAQKAASWYAKNQSSRDR